MSSASQSMRLERTNALPSLSPIDTDVPLKGDVRIIRSSSSVAAKAAWADSRSPVSATAMRATRRPSVEPERFGPATNDSHRHRCRPPPRAGPRPPVGPRRSPSDFEKMAKTITSIPGNRSDSSQTGLSINPVTGELYENLACSYLGLPARAAERRRRGGVFAANGGRYRGPLALGAPLGAPCLPHLVRDFNSATSSWIWRSVFITSACSSPRSCFTNRDATAAVRKGQKDNAHEHQNQREPALNGRGVDVAVPHRGHSFDRPPD